MPLQNEGGVVGKQNTGSQKQERSAAKNRSLDLFRYTLNLLFPQGLRTG